MKCPQCKDANLVLSERKSIEIDYCPDCRGIWLDRGELDKILERSREEEAPRREETRREEPSPSYHRHPEHGHKYYKRKKSFLEELFD